MKKTIKIVSLLSVFILIIITTAIPCFALVDNNSTQTGYITNIASRVDILSYSDKLTSVQLDNSVDTSRYDFKNLTEHYNSNNGYVNNTSNITTQIVHKQYNNNVQRVKATTSTAQVTVAKGMPPANIFNNYEIYSQYTGGRGTPVDSPGTTSQIINPGTTDKEEVQYTYGIQAKSYDFIFDDYYYDPYVSSSSPQGTLSLLTYVVVEDSAYATKAEILEKVLDRPITAIVGYYGITGVVYTTQIDIEPYNISSSRILRMGDYDYCAVQVNYRYEAPINETFSSACENGGVGISNSYATRVPSVRLEYSTLPANIGGVSGQGNTSPMIFSFQNFVYDSDVESVSKLPSWGTASTPTETTNLFRWIANTVGGVFDIELFGFFSLGDLLGICVGIGIVFVILKIFAGG